MKYTNKLLAVVAMMALLMGVSCGGDEPGPTPEPETPELAGAALVGTWVAQRDNAISGPNDDIEAKLAGFTLTITNPNATGVSYTTAATGAGDPNVFPGSGTFAIDSAADFTTTANMVRNPDDVTIATTLGEDGQALTLRFNIAPAVNARIAGITGDYVFILDKQEEEVVQ